MRISDWSSDVCASDLEGFRRAFDRIGKALVGLRIALRQPVLLGDVHGDADHMGAAIGIAHHLRARPHPDIMAGGVASSEEPRGGTECVSPCRSPWSSYH